MNGLAFMVFTRVPSRSVCVSKPFIFLRNVNNNVRTANVESLDDSSFPTLIVSIINIIVYNL